MADRAQLVRQVLKNLGVYQAGQDLPPEDEHAVDEALDGILASMAKLNIYTVEDADEIPDEAYMDIAAYAANEMAPTFGIVDPSELSDVKERAATSEMALRRMRVLRPTGQIVSGSYF